MTENSEIQRVPYGLAVHDHEEEEAVLEVIKNHKTCLLYTSPSPRDGLLSRMPSSA